nr:MAG TPA: hypothetical protein [Caudoviricetes sp.]
MPPRGTSCGIRGGWRLSASLTQEPILNPSPLTAGKTAPDRRVIRHQSGRLHSPRCVLRWP